MPTLGEILLGVINDLICADGSDQVDIPRTAYAGHLCAERLGDLHGERTHASRRTVYQDFLARLNVALGAKTLQCRERTHRHSSRLLKGDVMRLQGQCGFGSTRILGKGSSTGPETPAELRITRFEPRDFSANGFHLAGNIKTQSCDLWFSKSGHYAYEVRHASHKVPVVRIEGRRANFYQDLVVAGGRRFNLFTFKNVR